MPRAPPWIFDATALRRGDSRLPLHAGRKQLFDATALRRGGSRLPLHSELKQQTWDSTRQARGISAGSYPCRSCKRETPRDKPVASLHFCAKQSAALAFRSHARWSSDSPEGRVDALHIAIATVHGLDYLLTWNCTPEELSGDW